MLRDSAELLAPAVAETIAALELAERLAPADAAAVKLARQYAAAIDDAERAQELAERALAETDPEDVMTRAWVQALAAKVEVKEVLEKLGPRLHAVLESLGATPAARAKLKGGKPADGKPNRLQGLRNARGA